MVPTSEPAEVIEEEKISWTLPDAEPAWELEDGLPVVDTRQVDELWHTVTRYHTKQKLRSLYRVSYDTLQLMNPDVDLDHLHEGQ